MGRSKELLDENVSADRKIKDIISLTHKKDIKSLLARFIKSNNFFKNVLIFGHCGLSGAAGQEESPIYGYISICIKAF